LTGNFLTPLPPEHLLALAQRVGYEKVAVGSFIMREGMESDRVFLLLTGVVSVWERSSTSAAAAAAAMANLAVNKKAAASYAAAAAAAIALTGVVSLPTTATVPAAS
jgi:hypothetical protein